VEKLEDEAATPDAELVNGCFAVGAAEAGAPLDVQPDAFACHPHHRSATAPLPPTHCNRPRISPLPLAAMPRIRSGGLALAAHARKKPHRAEGRASRSGPRRRARLTYSGEIRCLGAGRWAVVKAKTTAMRWRLGCPWTCSMWRTSRSIGSMGSLGFPVDFESCPVLKSASLFSLIFFV